MTAHIDQFRDAIRAAGMAPPYQINDDGEIHRFSPDGRGDRDAWYVLHGDGIPAGAFGDWRTRTSTTWHANIGRPLRADEEQAHRDRIAVVIAARDMEKAQRQAKAAVEAMAIWNTSKSADPKHSYLARKQVRVHGLRVDDKGRLVVPLMVDGEIVSLQTITADGEKRFLSGGRVADASFTIGNIDKAQIFVICEGYATGATIYEAVGFATICAMNADNLIAVAVDLRRRFPSATIIVAADDDIATQGNPGVTKATAAARATGAHLALPEFGDERPARVSDFNDQAMHCGIASVAESIEAALDRMPLVSEVAEPLVTVHSPPKSGSTTPSRPRDRMCGLDVTIDHGNAPNADAGAPSEDAMALAFVESYGSEYRYVALWGKWYRWNGKLWSKDSTGNVFELIRTMIRDRVAGTKHERRTAASNYVAGVERLAHFDQRIVVLPEDLDADPWLLNTQSGIVDLRTGALRPHDPAALCTKIAGAALDPDEGRELWDRFIIDITQGDADLAAYMQRVAGYCATGATTEDILVYLFGIGANGKSSFAEAIAYALGDYAKVFPAEVLMESKGERHPTDLAQFMSVRFALTSEPASSAAWNDSRIKSLTGDATISARFMRGDFFEFARTHKTIVVGNHMPRLSDVTHAIKRRVQMVPFRAVFAPAPGPGMRERLKAEASGAILAWIVAGVAEWFATGTAPPKVVTDLTAEYFSEQDVIGQWLDERCQRDPKAFERSSELHRDYAAWCDAQGYRPKSNQALSAHLVSAGFDKRPITIGKVFYGLKLRS